MNDRERNRLLSKLNLLANDFEVQLEGVRRTQRDLGDRNPHSPLSSEISFLASYVDKFSIGAIQLAKETSRDPRALQIARAHCENLHVRFDRYLADYRNSRLLARSINNRPEMDRLFRQFQTAIETAVMRLVDAEFDFDEVPRDIRQQPAITAVDQWIKQCRTSNSKEAWRQIRNQRDFTAPLWKVFYERWKALRPAKPGRPRKRRD